MAYATFTDLLQVEPNIDEYGVLDWETELARSETEINRVLSVRWWPSRRVLLATNNLMDADLLDPTQWTQATVYHCLAFHICPKLTQFTPEEDKFSVMMKYYQGRFEHEMDLCIREGVRYDADDSDSFEVQEKRSEMSLRLKR